MGQHSDIALLMVLAAAFLHATWNAMLKHAGERAVMMALITFGHGLVGIVLLLGARAPSVESWPYIFASVIIHWFYYWFLLVSYRLGDLSQVYPIARGSAPLLVASGGWLFASETLGTNAWVGIALISTGIMMLALGSRNARSDTKAVGAALLTGLTIASYSVVDGLGVRLAGSPQGYIGWLFATSSSVMFFILWRQRARLSSLSARAYVTGFVGGVFSAGAYGLVIFAATLAPLGPISAVRESSVLIAALIGVVLFGERPWRVRVLSAGIVLCGILFLTVFSQ